MSRGFAGIHGDGNRDGLRFKLDATDDLNDSMRLEAAKLAIA